MRNVLKKPSQIAALLAAVGITSDLSVAQGAGVSGVLGTGPVQQVLTFKDVAIPLTDVASTVAYGSLKFFTFEAGQIDITGCVVDLDITKSSAGVNNDWDGDFGIGTVAAAGDATLSSTEQNVVATTATPQAVAGATTAKGKLTAGAVLDGSSDAVDLYLNVLVDDADQDVTTTACNLIFNGTITLTYQNNGAA